jgi:hypothetical protein
LAAASRGSQFLFAVLNPNDALATLTPKPIRMLHHPSPLLAFLGLGGAELAVIVAIMGIIFGGIMGIVAMFFQHQRKKLAHDVARLALEKGQPVPPQFAGEEHRRPDRPGTDLNQHDLRGGLVLIGVGAGVYLFLDAVADHRVALLGAVPGFIGIALLVNWLLVRLLTRKRDNPPPPAA